MHRRLFCELSPLAYRISVEKSCALRTLRDGFSAERFPKLRLEAPLPALVCRRLSRRAMSQSSSSPSASSRRAYQAPRPLDAPVMMAMFMEILPVRRHSQKFPTLYQIYK